MEMMKCLQHAPYILVLYRYRHLTNVQYFGLFRWGLTMTGSSWLIQSLYFIPLLDYRISWVIIGLYHRPHTSGNCPVSPNCIGYRYFNKQYHVRFILLILPITRCITLLARCAVIQVLLLIINSCFEKKN